MRVLSGIVMGLAVLAAGCDREGRFVEEAGLEKLEPGVSRESDVRMVFGPPDAVVEEGGSRTLHYPRGPAGSRTWFFEVDEGGVLRGWRQVLTEENFARIAPGMEREQVRRMLGRPRSVAQYRLKNEEVWDWNFLEDHHPKLFNVHFDMDSGKVVRKSYSLIDPERPN